jgi:hypothetical protein
VSAFDAQISQITSQIAAAASAGKPFSALMVTLLTLGLANLAAEGRPVFSYQIAGKSVTYNHQQIIQQIEYYRGLAIIEVGQEVVSQPVEFRDGWR